MDRPKKGELTVRVTGPEGAAIQVAVAANATKENAERLRAILIDHLNSRFEEIQSQ